MEIIIKCSDDCRGRKDIYGYIYINHVQEIVRYKDCKHSKGKISDRVQCKYFNAWLPFDFYCAWGERKDNETD